MFEEMLLFIPIIHIIICVFSKQKGSWSNKDRKWYIDAWVHFYSSYLYNIFAWDTKPYYIKGFIEIMSDFLNWCFSW